MDLSVIISTYNNTEKLKLTLKYLFKQKNIENYDIEIIIVDDYSEENVAETIKYIIEDNQVFKKVEIIRNEKNLGLAASRNVGAGQAISELLLFMDNDIILTPYVLWLHINTYKSKFVQMCISRIFDISRKDFNQVMSALESMDTLEEGYLNINLEKKMDPLFEIREEILNKRKLENNVIWPFGAFFCTSVSKKVFNEIGGFDSGYIGWGPEDIDFSYRVYKNGSGIKYCETAVCYHMDNRMKNIDTFIKDISRNLKYMSNKYLNKEIWYYLNFYKGSISFEEFEALMNNKSFDAKDYDKLNKIGILKLIYFKCE